MRESEIARTMKNVKRRCSNLKILITYVPFRTGIWPMLEPYSEIVVRGIPVRVYTRTHATFAVQKYLSQSGIRKMIGRFKLA